MNLELFLSVVAGAFLYLLFSLNEIYGKPEFKWAIFFKQNWLSTFTNLVCGVIIVWKKDSITAWLPMVGLVPVFVGFGAQTLLKRIFKIFDKKVDTFIGVNG